MTSLNNSNSPKWNKSSTYKMNTLHARGGRIIPKLPIYEYPHETCLKNTSMVIRLFTRTKKFDAKFRFSKVESLVGGGVGPPPPPYSHMADYHTTYGNDRVYITEDQIWQKIV